MLSEEVLACLVVRAPPRLILVHADLFDDNLLLHVEILDPQAGPQDVGEQSTAWGVLGQHGGVEDGVFLAGEGVVVGSDAIEVAIDLQGGAAACP